MRKSLFTLLIALGTALTSASQGSGPADLIVRGGTILTGDPDNPSVEAMAVQGERVLAVGTATSIARVQGEHTEIIELNGAAVMPGLVDSHTHLVNHCWIGTHDYRVGVTKDQLLGIVAEDVANESDLPVHVMGWVPLNYSGTRDELDAISATRPILVQSFDGAGWLLNSAAIEWLQIEDPDAGAPATGADRDQQGRLTGRFVGPQWNVWVNRQAIALTPDEVLRQNALNEARGFAATGRTTVHNMATSARAMSVLISLVREGLLPLRVREFYSGFSASDKEFARSVSDVSERWYRVLGAKYFLDGTPFKGDASYVGIQYSGPVLMSQTEIEAAIADAVAHGEQPAFHSSGQLSAHAVLDAIDAIGPAATGIRVRLEHQDIAFPEDLARIADEGVFVSMQPAHFGVFSPPFVPPDAYLPLDWYLFHSYMDAGATVILGSDMSAPPLVQLAMATLGPTPWNPVEAMTFDEALRAMTSDAAAGARGDEHHVGRLRPGMLADFVVVSGDPSKMPPGALFGLQVLRTVVGGRTVFAAQ
jgi:predicted amidohydrolase YtcJ